MKKEVKYVKPGASQRLRDWYNKNILKQPMSEELKDILRKDSEKTERKKIARPSGDAEVL